MRRSLVLTNENARHPMRAGLPSSNTTARRVVKRRNITWRLFGDHAAVANTYIATFAATLAFIL